MAFGQASGPPASARQIQELADLLEARGFDSFKEARHPFGLTQRQAGGKFTVEEVTELIGQLADGSDDSDSSSDDVLPSAPSPTCSRRAASPTVPAWSADSERVAARALRRQEDAAVELLSEVMATELSNRGWCCIPPPEG